MYPNVQDNLKLPVEEHVILEEPASSTGTLSSVHHLDKDFNFSDQFLNDKSSDAKKEKTRAEVEVESMITVTIQQDTSSVPPMTFKVVDLPRPRLDDPYVHSPLQLLPQHLTNTSIESRLNDAFNHIADLVQANLNLEERIRKVGSYDLSGMIEKQMQGYLQIASNLDGRIDKHASRLSAMENLNISYKVKVSVDEIVTDAVDWAMQAPLRARFNLEEARRKKRKKRDSPRTPSRSPPPQPPPPPPPAGTSDVENNWATALASTYEPPAKNSLLAKTGDMTTFMNWYCQKVKKTVLTQANFEGQAYEVVKAFYPNVIHLQFQMEECHKMLTDQIN
ncbi:hypothetical protein Tco_1079772 [Tanacetum coccineum]|uniref:Uncharacterized protein n=1 Tax=Tanacetum coccineum TaxID=301880 RepID=A0ABQ5HUJ3_9ASTR